MSVYNKELAANLFDSMESIYEQTIPTDDFVVVCDGPLNYELDAVLETMREKFGSVLNIVRLEKNSGLGNALNIGIEKCKHELVARMDSDDISFKERCEKQLKVFLSEEKPDIVSGTIIEFSGNIRNITGKRELPLTHEEICNYSKKRNPFNHPAVMFRKTAVLDAGSYSEQFPLFEDYYLWIRMLCHGSRGCNIADPILYMRVSEDSYMRRGGKQYAKNLLAFHSWLSTIGWTKKSEYILGTFPHAALCIMPNKVRAAVYKAIHK